MSEKKQKDPSEKLGFGRLMLWNSRGVSTTIYTVLAAYLMNYCTDILGVTPAYISIILVVSKLVDGVSDACAGFIVDRTKTKWGKARPYEIFILGMWICTWLMFSCPTGLSEIMKCVWIFVMYTLVNSICYTFLNANSTVYMVRAFKGSQIVKATSYSSVIVMLSALIFNIGFPQLLANFGQTASGWSLMAGGFAISMAGIGILRMLFIPEKYDIETQQGKEENLKVSDIFELIKGNRYILTLALMSLVFNVVTNMGTQVYFYQWIVGNVGLMSVSALAQVVALPLAFVFPALLKKTTVVKLMFVGFFVSSAGYLLNFFAGQNAGLLAFAAILTGAGTIPGTMLVSLAVLECAEYNEWKGRPRMEGTMSSVIGLANKVGAAVGSASLGVLLTIVGYDGSLAVQSNTTMLGIRLLFSIVPMVIYVLVAVALTGYFKLDKQMPQIRKENEEKRAAAIASKERKE